METAMNEPLPVIDNETIVTSIGYIKGWTPDMLRPPNTTIADRWGRPPAPWAPKIGPGVINPSPTPAVLPRYRRELPRRVTIIEY